MHYVLGAILLILTIPTQLLATQLTEKTYVEIVSKEVLIASRFGAAPLDAMQKCLNHLHTLYEVTPFDIYEFGLYYKKNPKKAIELDQKIRAKIGELKASGWKCDPPN